MRAVQVLSQKNFCNQKCINQTLGDNIKNEYLRIKKLDFNRKGNSVCFRQKENKFYCGKVVLKPIKVYL